MGTRFRIGQMAFLWNRGFFWKCFCLTCIRCTCYVPSVLPLKMSFLESVLFKNLFHFICILDFWHFCCVIYLFSFSFFCHFIFFCRSVFFFCWSSINSWDRSGGVLVFKVVFPFKLFGNKTGPVINLHGGSNIRVFEARGLEGLLGLLGLLEGGWNNVV